MKLDDAMVICMAWTTGAIDFAAMGYSQDDYLKARKQIRDQAKTILKRRRPKEQTP